MKATKLIRPNITKVDAVPAGANQGAAIMLFKSQTGEMAEQIANTVANSPLAKADAKTVAQTFDAKIQEATIRQRISDNWWKYTDTLRESVFSIMLDPKLDDATRKTMLQTTFKEFAECMIPSLTAPATAVQKKGAKVSANRMAGLLRTHAELAGIIKEGCGSTDAMREHLEKLDADECEDEGDDEDMGMDEEEDDDTSKGRLNNDEEEIDDMKIDKSKFTAEEAATFDALVAKGTTTDTTTVETTPAAPVTDPNVTKALDEANKALASVTETVTKMQDAADLAAITLTCKKYEAIPGIKVDEVAGTVHALRKAKQDTAADAYLKQLDTTLGIVEKSGLFVEKGRAGDGSAQQPEEIIKGRAQEIIKANPSVTMNKAMAQAWTEHPELVQEYERSRRGK